MKYERWLIPETDDAAVEALMDAGYPYLVSTVLASRGVVTPEQAAAHLDRERSLVYSPFLMRDMDKAVARIDRALAGGETIAVFGDYDVDGITSTCLLTDYLRSRGAEIIGKCPVSGYEFSDSSAVVDGEFVGLPLDDDNEPEKSEARISAWCGQLKAEAGL